MACALNARGAMEIVLANFAYQSKLISVELLTSLVIMAIGTTFLIKPALYLRQKWKNQPEPLSEDLDRPSKSLHTWPIV